MIPIRPQTIRSASGEELVVLTRAEFDALASAASDHIEDADDVVIFDERMKALADGDDAPLPAEVTAAMLAGSTLLRALRRHRKITQSDLAEKTGLAQGYISDIESGRKVGSEETLSRIAAVLDVPPARLGAKS